MELYLKICNNVQRRGEESLKKKFYNDYKNRLPYSRYLLFTVLSWITIKKIQFIEKYKEHYNQEIESGKLIR